MGRVAAMRMPFFFSSNPSPNRLKPKSKGPSLEAARGIRPKVLWVLSAVVAGAVVMTVLLWRREPQTSSRQFQSAGASPAQTDATRAASAVHRLRPQSHQTRGGEADDPDVVARRVATVLKDAFQGKSAATPLQVPELIALLKDSSRPAKDRRKAASALARNGSGEAVAALKEALGSAPSGVRAAIAESLGQCSHPEANGLLMGLLNDPDELTAAGAIRGMAGRNSSESVSVLASLLQDTQKPAAVRTEAALGLGAVSQPEAMATLVKAATEVKDVSIASHVLEGIGGRPFEETKEFFTAYLQSPDLPPELKAAALEALAHTRGDASSFLLPFLQDSDPQARAAAAWALSAAETRGNLAPQVGEQLKQESSSEVRTRLYQALDNQANLDARVVLALVQGETQPEARLAGIDVLAGQLDQGKAPELLDFFNRTAVPELTSLAVDGASGHDRLAAVLALRRASTPEAMQALSEIATHAQDPKVLDAVRVAVNRSPHR
jgi:HEAT repeat protein